MKEDSIRLGNESVALGSDNMVEIHLALELDYAVPTPSIWLYEWDYRRRLCIHFFDRGKKYVLDHTHSCKLYFLRCDGQEFVLDPLPYEDGTNQLEYEFTEPFADVPGQHYIGVVFKEHPDETGCSRRQSTPEIILNIIDTSLPKDPPFFP